MNIVDLQEKHQSYYTASEQPELVNIPEATYVSILGEGRPGRPQLFMKRMSSYKGNPENLAVATGYNSLNPLY